MKVEARDLRDKNRVNLWDVVPLPAPFVIYLDTGNVCNARCSFCPTGDNELRRGVPRGLMTLDTIDKIITGLQALPGKVHQINLYKDGEPLLNPHFCEIVHRLKRASVAERLWTKTNGLLLSPAMNERLIASGLDMIGISVKAVSSWGYYDVAWVKTNYQTLIANVTDLYNRRGNVQIYASIADSGLTDADKDKFYTDFMPISDFTAVEGLHGWSNSGAKDFQVGTRPVTFDGTPMIDKIVCPLALCALGINWNGTIGLCNEDWGWHTIVGNLQTDTLPDIWNGDRLYELRRMHLEGRRSENQSCGDCKYLSCLPDNVDAFRYEMLRRLDERK